MASYIQEELIKKFSDFLIRKYEKKEIENNYTNLNFIGKERYNLIFSTIDQNRIEWIKILFMFAKYLNEFKFI